jgi:hypothetical protein
LAFAVVNVAVFLVVLPALSDLYAAMARASAAGHGVGLTYWFAWFSGGSTPASYSILSPWLGSVFGVKALLASSTLAITPLSWRLFRATLPRPEWGVAFSTLLAGVNLWSGHVPFTLGWAVSLAVGVALLSRRFVSACILAVLTALVSPVSAVFLLLALCGVGIARRETRRFVVAPAACAVVCLSVIGWLFGTPGNEGFSATQCILSLVVLGCFLLIRPSSEIGNIIWLVGVLCIILAIVPNSLGSNIERFPRYILPGLVVASIPRPPFDWTRWVNRKAVAALLPVAAVLPACAFSVSQAVGDTLSAWTATSRPSYYAPLVAEVDSLGSQLANCRIEVLDNPDHGASYALLGHAALARGWEAQDDHAYDGVLLASRLSARDYRGWLDANAVCFVAVPHMNLSYPEYRLVVSDTPGYLTPVWGDGGWTLYRVGDSTGIGPSLAQVIRQSQSAITIDVLRAGTYELRIHYSRFLAAVPLRGQDSGSAGEIYRAPGGWCRAEFSRPGLYELTGRF